MDCRGTRLEAGRPVRPLAFVKVRNEVVYRTVVELNMVRWTGLTDGREQECVEESHPNSEVCVVLVWSLSHA